MKSTKSGKIKTLFTKGDLSSVYISYQKKLFQKEDQPWILATLCLLGKTDEASKLSIKKQTSSFELFFLSMAFTRKGDYPKAKYFLKELTKNKHKSVEDLYFYYQSIAFYAFFNCRYRVSLSFAKKSRHASLHLSESFWKILAIDLLGHNQVHMGDLYQGIHNLKEAQELAKILENKAFDQATTISILSYQAQHSITPHLEVENILKILKKIYKTDNYSEGLLNLNLTHLYLLMGQVDQAEKILAKAQAIIFGNNIARHIGSWHFEKAYLHYLQGREELALAELQAAQDKIQEGRDLKLELKILGLKFQILSQNNCDLNSLRERIVHLTMRIGQPSAINKLARLGLCSFQHSQDPLQFFFDQLKNQKWENLLSEMISMGYFGILREKVQCKNEFYFVTGLWKNGALFISPQEILGQKDGFSELILKAFLLINSKKKVSKEELLEKLWGHKYDPTRHDTIIYTLIHRLRKSMGKFSWLLIGENHHYHLSQHFKVIELHTKISLEEESEDIFQKQLLSKKSWNIRQHRCLVILNKGTYWQVSDYARYFSVSLMTALRDLTELTQAGKIEKFGQARVTTYAIRNEKL